LDGLFSDCKENGIKFSYEKYRGQGQEKGKLTVPVEEFARYINLKVRSSTDSAEIGGNPVAELVAHLRVIYDSADKRYGYVHALVY